MAGTGTLAGAYAISAAGELGGRSAAAVIGGGSYAAETAADHADAAAEYAVGGAFAAGEMGCSTAAGAAAAAPVQLYTAAANLKFGSMDPPRCPRCSVCSRTGCAAGAARSPRTR